MVSTKDRGGLLAGLFSPMKSTFIKATAHDDNEAPNDLVEALVIMCSGEVSKLGPKDFYRESYHRLHETKDWRVCMKSLYVIYQVMRSVSVLAVKPEMTSASATVSITSYSSSVVEGSPLLSFSKDLLDFDKCFFNLSSSFRPPFKIPESVFYQNYIATYAAFVEETAIVLGVYHAIEPSTFVKEKKGTVPQEDVIRKINSLLALIEKASKCFEEYILMSRSMGGMDSQESWRGSSSTGGSIMDQSLRSVVGCGVKCCHIVMLLYLKNLDIESVHNREDFDKKICNIMRYFTTEGQIAKSGIETEAIDQFISQVDKQISSPKSPEPDVVISFENPSLSGPVASVSTILEPSQTAPVIEFVTPDTSNPSVTVPAITETSPLMDFSTGQSGQSFPMSGTSVVSPAPPPSSISPNSSIESLISF